VILYRVFPWDKASTGSGLGGPLYVPRAAQGQGRHDLPSRDGVLYSSKSPVSAIAEWIQMFRTRPLRSVHFGPTHGLVRALARLELPDTVSLVDLDDPRVLVEHSIKPSELMTHARQMTQKWTARLYGQGHPGFFWPSTLESQWINATLFETRVRDHLKLVGQSQGLTTDMPEVRQAAAALGMEIGDENVIRR